MNVRIGLIFFAVFLAILSSGRGLAEEAGGNYVVILLDTSGSMNDPMPGTSKRKMGVAQEALNTVMNQISPGTRVGLLTFSSINRPDPWAYPLGSLNLDQLNQALSTLTPGGDTPLGSYIKKAADRLLEEREKNFGYGTYKLLIVTDGEAQDRNLVDRFTPDVISRGITMDVIGVAMKKDHTLATRVHSYRRADDPEALTQALIQVFAEVGGKDGGDENEAGFDELAAIPDGLASSLITALSSSGNQPIGERSGGDPMNKPLLDPSQQSTAPPNPPSATSKDKTPFSTYLWIAAGIGVLFSLFGGRKKKGKRKRR